MSPLVLSIKEFVTIKFSMPPSKLTVYSFYKYIQVRKKKVL